MSLHFEYLQAMLLPANASRQRKGWNPKEEGFIDLDRMSERSMIASKTKYTMDY